MCVWGGGSERLAQWGYLPTGCSALPWPLNWPPGAHQLLIHPRGGACHSSGASETPTCAFPPPAWKKLENLPRGEWQNAYQGERLSRGSPRKKGGGGGKERKRSSYRCKPPSSFQTVQTHRGLKRHLPSTPQPMAWQAKRDRVERGTPVHAQEGSKVRRHSCTALNQSPPPSHLGPRSSGVHKSGSHSVWIPKIPQHTPPLSLKKVSTLADFKD